MRKTGISRLTTEFLACRSFGHAWNPTKVDVTRNTRGVNIEYTQHLKCLRCESERRQGITFAGDILGNRYTYAAGYLKRKDEEFKREDVRLSYLLRVLDV